MFRLNQLVLTALLVSGLAGCNSENITNSTDPSPPPEQIENTGDPPVRTPRQEKPGVSDELKPLDEAADTGEGGTQ